MVTGLPRVVCFSTRSFSTFVTRIRTIPPGGRRPAADDRRGGMGGRVTGGSLVPSLPVSFLNLHLRAVGPDRREVERENGARPTTGRGRKARGMESLEEPRVERDTRRGSHYPSKLFIPLRVTYRERERWDEWHVESLSASYLTSSYTVPTPSNRENERGCTENEGWKR